MTQTQSNLSLYPALFIQVRAGTDVLHGRGVLLGMRECKGMSYDGEWRENERHGAGIYTYSDGSVYVGEWRQDVRSGHGAYWPYDGRCCFQACA